MLLLELGVGMNTPGIIKYPFLADGGSESQCLLCEYQCRGSLCTGRNQGEGYLCEWGYWGGYLPMSLTLLYGMGII